MDQVAATPRKILGIYLTSLFVLLVVISYQVNDPVSGRSVLGTIIFRILSPAQLILAETYSGISELAHTYFVLVQTNEENKKLHRELTDLKIQLSAMQHQQMENDRLRKIVQLKQNRPYELIVGEVIGRDAKAALSQTIAVNRGSRNGVRRQLPVVTPEGIVGMTIQVDLFTSRILLITDASASFGAMLQNGRIAGILQGAGGGRCVLRFLPSGAVFKKGDLVVTSGQDKIFPEGLMVGRVAQSLHESEFYKSAEIAPFQNFSALDEVVFLLQTAGQAPADAVTTPQQAPR